MLLKKHILSLLLICFGLFTTVAFAQPDAPRPTAAKAFAANDVTVELYSDGIKQGRVGVVRVLADNLTVGNLTIFDTTVPLFTVPDEADALYGFVAVDMDQPVRTYELTVSVTANNQNRALIVPLDVRSGGFIRQDVTLREDLLMLIDPVVEEIELTNLAEWTAPLDTPPQWLDAGFQMPVPTELTSPFGAVRLFNEQFETRHTGWDFRGGMGDLMRAASNGRVVYASDMDIRGGYVLIDHGYGVYSGYAHMSVIHVVEGQTVQKGQLLGLAGNTGRSSDPHLHFEMRVHGRWIDPVDFMGMWLPS